LADAIRPMVLAVNKEKNCLCSLTSKVFIFSRIEPFAVNALR
jgi:hypothetical protein